MTMLQIAEHLFVSRKTIQNNASSFYRRLGAGGRAEAGHAPSSSDSSLPGPHRRN